MAKTTTKQKIIDTAVRLFNEKGSVNISTRHIAEALKISPGNLYYYFKNKEAIIRAIMNKVSAEFDGLYTLEEGKFDFYGYLSHLSAILWEYRFFQREVVLLLKNDPLLKETFSKVQKKRIEEVKAMIQVMIEAGMVIPLSERELDAFVTNSWIVINFWHSHMEIDGDTSKEALERGVENMMLMAKPYLTPKAYESFETFNTKKETE